MSEPSTKTVILRLFAVVRPYVGLIVVCGLAVLIKEIARVSVFVFVGRALDAGVERVLELTDTPVESMARAGKAAPANAEETATVEHTDAIAVLEDGRIVERGTHAELLTLGGRYAAYHREQFVHATGGAD